MSEDTLLSTKLIPPLSRPGLVARARLVGQLAAGMGLGRRLSLVSAPPGFGKTTLIGEWAGSAGRQVAWLTLGESDDDARRFMRYLAAAVAQTAGREPQTSNLASPKEQLVALINALAQPRADLLLVLDDYHLITDFAVHDLVAFLLANPPPGLHLVIGTREDPPLPLARLRARDQITEIRERALRFTTDEAAAFLGQTMGLGLSPSLVASLAARTEGWITGLQLAGLALCQPAEATSQGGSAEAFVAAFAGNDRYIADYLIAEVLDREPEPIREFLRQTAVLDRLSGPLCDALSGRNDSQAVLEQLESANVFVTSLDTRREWYRYHVLFAEMLRLTLSLEERIELHKQAASWLEAHGFADGAMRHINTVAGLLTAQGTIRVRKADQPLVEPLSEREIEVLQLMAEGYSNADIAQKLYIATGTVKRHTNNIYGKLAADSRTQAIAKARAMGLLK